MKCDVLADALSTIKNARRRGKKECTVKPASKLIIEVLKVMQNNNYIGVFEQIPDKKGGTIKVEISEKLNNCNVIKPRFFVKRNEILKFESRFLPSRNLGILVLTTPSGVKDHKEAKEIGTGGVLLAYAY